MARPRIIIADTEVDYVIPLQMKFVEEFFEKIDLEIITDKAYFNEKFSAPQRADVLIISEEMYDPAVQRHNIANIFLMAEQPGEGGADAPGLTKIYKYTSIKDIFHQMIGKCGDVLKVCGAEKKETKVIVVYSANGGAGKTTVALGMCAGMAQNFKNVLYVNASHLQMFQDLLENPSAITSNGIYGVLARGAETVYDEVKHLIRKEGFSYLPPFKAALLSLGVPYNVYKTIVKGAKKSNEYDYIVVDVNSTFDEGCVELLAMADKVLVVTNQTEAAISATNLFLSNINGSNKEKYNYVCNKFNKDETNGLISPEVSLKFTVDEYVEYFARYEQMRPKDFAADAGMQRVTFLMM